MAESNDELVSCELVSCELVSCEDGISRGHV